MKFSRRVRGNIRRPVPRLVHQVRDWFSGVAIKMGPPARRSEPDWHYEGAYLNRYVTEEQRSRRPFSSQPSALRVFLAGCFVAHRSKTTAGILPLRFAHPAKIRSSAANQSRTWCTSPDDCRHPVPISQGECEKCGLARFRHAKHTRGIFFVFKDRRYAEAPAYYRSACPRRRRL